MNKIYRRSYPQNSAEELFTKYDADGDQRLSEAEIRAFAKDLGVEVSPEAGRCAGIFSNTGNPFPMARSCLV